MLKFPLQSSRPPRAICLILGFTLACALAQEPVPPAPGPTAPGAGAAQPPLKPIAPGVFELGGVRLAKNKGQISFPAAFNMTEGLIEYWLVSSAGKLHESVFRTEIEPYHIHLAMLLIGAKGGPSLSPQERAETRTVSGQPIQIWVEWEHAGSKQRVRAEDLVFNEETKTVMSRGPWIYNGSWVFEGMFVAQRERSVVAIIFDPDALVNNPRPGHHNDEIWLVRQQELPPVGTGAEVIFILEAEPKKSSPAAPEGNATDQP